MPHPLAPMRVLITICTRNRPKGLDACLASVCALEKPENAEFEIAIIENNDHVTMEEIAARHRAASGIPIHLVNESELGLPFARNRCGTLAVELGFDWLLYIDDDEIAAPDWFRIMVEAARRYEADVFYGRVVPVHPPGTPEWMEAPDVNKRPTGTQLTKAEGHNTLVRARVFDDRGMGLRFDTTMRFTGGSDTDFFTRVHQAGGRIVWVGDAIVDETIPASRMTLRWQLHRTFRVAINISVLHEKKSGRAAAVLKSLTKGTGRLLGGIVSLPLGLVALVAPLRGKILAFKAAKQIASGLGSFAYIIGIRPQPYRVMDGT